MCLGILENIPDDPISIRDRQIIAIVGIIFRDPQRTPLIRRHARQIRIVAAHDVNEKHTPLRRRQLLHDIDGIFIIIFLPKGRITTLCDQRHARTRERASIMERDPVRAIPCSPGRIHHTDCMRQIHISILVRTRHRIRKRHEGIRKIRIRHVVQRKIGIIDLRRKPRCRVFWIARRECLQMIPIRTLPDDDDMCPLIQPIRRIYKLQPGCIFIQIGIKILQKLKLAPLAVHRAI